MLVFVLTAICLKFGIVLFAVFVLLFQLFCFLIAGSFLFGGDGVMFLGGVGATEFFFGIGLGLLCV